MQREPFGAIREQWYEQFIDVDVNHPQHMHVCPHSHTQTHAYTYARMYARTYARTRTHRVQNKATNLVGQNLVGHRSTQFSPNWFVHRVVT